MPDVVIKGYTQDAEQLICRYESVSTEKLFAPALHMLPKTPGQLLDIGAGTGRDAAWFAAKRWKVTTVEPAGPLQKAAKELHPHPDIEWVNDRLPVLGKVINENKLYDLVTLTAVWQHLTDEERVQSLKTIYSLMKPSGLFMLTLRSGLGAATRPCYECKAEHARKQIEEAGFHLLHDEERPSLQPQNCAAAVTWTWFILTK